MFLGNQIKHPGSEGGAIPNLCRLHMESNVLDGYGMEYVGPLEGP